MHDDLITLHNARDCYDLVGIELKLRLLKLLGDVERSLVYSLLNYLDLNTLLRLCPAKAWVSFPGCLKL